MDPADLLDYALGRLEGPRRERLERRLACEPALAERVARLVRNLRRLLDDGRADRPAGGSPAPASPTAPPVLPDSVRSARPDVQGDRPPSDSR